MTAQRTSELKSLSPEALSLKDLRALGQTDYNGPGVYFLWRDDELLYVGAAIRVVNRICHQAQIRDFPLSPNNFYRMQVPFNRYTILPCAKEKRSDLERFFIEKYEPPYNESAIPEKLPPPRDGLRSRSERLSFLKYCCRHPRRSTTTYRSAL